MKRLLFILMVIWAFPANAWEAPKWTRGAGWQPYQGVLEYRHTHRQMRQATGFFGASPRALVRADILRGLREATETRAAEVILGPNFYTLSHGEQRAVLIAFVGRKRVILRDGLSKKKVGVFNRAGGVLLY